MFPRNKVSMLLKFHTFFNKIYKHAYLVIIYISARYENTKMHRKGGHNCPIYDDIVIVVFDLIGGGSG